jgi:hypothetical protein
MSAVAIYYRSGEIIVVPQAGGGGGFIDIEPIETVGPDAASVQAAIERALVISAASATREPPKKPWKTPLLAYAGARSYAAFMQGRSLCWVFEDVGVHDVERWQPARDGRGYEPAPGRQQRVDRVGDVGNAVLRLLDIA